MPSCSRRWIPRNAPRKQQAIYADGDRPVCSWHRLPRGGGGVLYVNACTTTRSSTTWNGFKIRTFNASLRHPANMSTTKKSQLGEAPTNIAKHKKRGRAKSTNLTAQKRNAHTHATASPFSDFNLRLTPTILFQYNTYTRRILLCFF